MPPRTKTQLPYGSAQWIQDENTQISHFVTQETEDFAFSARNEVEWLNEHMAEIFSKSQVNVTEIFKTPGKLRGKTPRTIRKQNPLDNRQPLTDIFSANATLKNVLSQKNTPIKVTSKFPAAKGPIPSPLLGAKSGNEKVGDVIQAMGPPKSKGTPKVFPSPSNVFSTENSKFQVAKDPTPSNIFGSEHGNKGDGHDGTQLSSASKPNTSPKVFPPAPNPFQSEVSEFQPSKDPTTSTLTSSNEEDGVNSRSPTKLIESPKIFHSQPNSFGIEDDGQDVIQPASPPKPEASAELFSSKLNTPTKQMPKSSDAEYRTTPNLLSNQLNSNKDGTKPGGVSDSNTFLEPAFAQLKSARDEKTRLQTANAPIPSKLLDKTWIDSGYHGMSQDDMVSQEYPKDLVEEQATTEGSFHSAREDVTGAGIPKESEFPVEMDVDPSPETDIPAQSISKPLPTTEQTPIKKMARSRPDNENDDDDWIQPISASKSKIQSIMKTARGLFTSSAGVSAQAKMETLTSQKSPHIMRTRGQAQVHAEGEIKFKSPHAIQTRSAQGQAESATSLKSPHSARTRGALGQTESNINLKSPHSTRTRVALGQVESDSNFNSPHSMQTRGQAQEPDGDIGMGNSEVASHQNPPQAQSSQPQRGKDQRRPVKPAKEPASKPKPQPVAIRVGTLSQRIPLSNAALSSTLQESLAPPQQKQPGPAKRAINASLQAIEKRRLEAARKEQQRQAAQQEKTQPFPAGNRHNPASAAPPPKQPLVVKKASNASLQAIEKRRLEAARREQERQGLLQEKSQPFSTTNRHELGGVRAPSRIQTVQDYNRPFPKQPSGNPTRPPAKNVFEPELDDEMAAPVRIQPSLNPARPPIKRAYEPEFEDEPAGPVRIPGGPSYQQMDKKRRRTEDEDLQQTMARPPIRQSSIRKDVSKQSIYGNNHAAQRPSNNYHQSQSMLKTSTLNQTYQQHQHPGQPTRPGPFAEMAKYTNGKIPFAEAPNPPHKSPLRPKKSAAGSAKSSPQYINGEHIELEEIPTDSDEEESEDEKARKSKGAMLAEWAQSPQLRKILEEQEKNANADEIFGPPASPHMEEMFKERRDRFRNRTSSANWNGSDRLTEEEIRLDRAGRERLRKEGGWFFGL